jgi:hypothetical protein
MRGEIMTDEKLEDNDPAIVAWRDGWTDADGELELTREAAIEEVLTKQLSEYRNAG